MTNQYHATPYDINATGFYFNTYDEYVEKASTHKNDYGDPVEEYEIQFINGDNYQLFNALGINQANLEKWFEDFENLDTDDEAKAIYLAEYTGYEMQDILDQLDDICLFKGTAEEYAEEYIEDTDMLADMPENLRYYFDTEAFASDMVTGGDITVLEINNVEYVAWGG